MLPARHIAITSGEQLSAPRGLFKREKYTFGYLLTIALDVQDILDDFIGSSDRIERSQRWHR